jgi:hypothetical protein
LGKTFKSLGFCDSQELTDATQTTKEALVSDRNSPCKFHLRAGQIVYGELTSSIVHYNHQPHNLSVIRDVTEKKLTEDLLLFLSKLRWTQLEQNPINELLIHLRGLTGADTVFAGVVAEGNSTIQTLSFIVNGIPTPNFTYHLEGSPCKLVVRGETCIYNHHVQEIFPQDIGLMRLNAESYIGVPLMDTKDRIIGLMVAIHSKPFQSPQLIANLLNDCLKPTEYRN